MKREPPPALPEEIWVPLLEKAIAKFCGNYGEIYGGMESWVFNVLTGQTPEILQKTNKGWVSGWVPLIIFWARMAQPFFSFGKSETGLQLSH